MYEKIITIFKSRIGTEEKKIALLSVVVFLLSTVTLFDKISVFGLAAFSCISKKKYAIYSSLSCTLGYLLNGEPLTHFIEILICVLLCSLVFFDNKFINSSYDYFNVLIFCLIKILVSFMDDSSIYSILYILFQGVIFFAFSKCFGIFVSCVTDFHKKRLLSKLDAICLSAVILIASSSFSNLYLPYDINILSCVYLLIMLFVSYEFSFATSATVGIILGIGNSINNINMIHSVISFALSGLISSFAQKISKFGVVSTFVGTNALFTYLINNSENILINIYEIFIASIIFLCIPEEKMSVTKNFILNLFKSVNKDSERIKIIKAYADNRLSKLCDAFESISAVLVSDNENTANTFEKNLPSMIKSVGDRVCRKCKCSKKCWNNKNFSTRAIIESLFYANEKRGWAELYDTPLIFREMCYNANQLVVEANKIYELFRMNKIWEMRAEENKSLISQQFNSMKAVVSDLADDLKGQYLFRKDLEDILSEAFVLNSFKVISITVMCVNTRHIAIRGAFKNEYSFDEASAISVCESILNKKFKIFRSSVSAGIKYLDFYEKELFDPEIGISRIRPDIKEQSGDSYSIIRPDNEKIIVALSDGMGKGNAAAEESKNTVNLLEKLLAAGIEKNTVVKLINSVLILKSYDESFATIDMLVFDLYTGEGEFIKTGGVSSYVLSNNKLDEIYSSSLPAGIVSNTQSSFHKKVFKENDIILIVSDGVTDIQGGEWILEVLTKNQYKSAKEIADHIIEHACKLIDICRDDMTAIVIKINLK